VDRAPGWLTIGWRDALSAGRRTATVALVTVVVLAVPSPAWAHGVSGTADNASTFRGLGFRHMLLGWDHLLFIGGVLLVAHGLETAMKLLTVFAS
jgi:hypothetical protein